YKTGEAIALRYRCNVTMKGRGTCGNNGIQRCLNDSKETKYFRLVDQCSKCEDSKPPKYRTCSCSQPNPYQCK
ncbi:unnamed protein product, partial [Brassica rapa subsp. trilocularis]